MAGRATRWLLPFGALASLLSPSLLQAAEPVAFTAPLPARSTRKPGTLSPLPCPVPLAGKREGVDYACGTYTVPLDYAAPRRGAIDLTYRVIRAPGPVRHPDPIVPLSGGPGQSVLVAGGDLYAGLGRDVVQLAQRGTLFSQRVDLEECVGLLVAQGATRAQLESLVTEAQRKKGDSDAAGGSFADRLSAYSARSARVDGPCMRAFRKAGVDPRLLSTRAAARDLAGLLAALGYERYNVHAVSYGTRVAETLMRDHPGGLRSVILDSTSPLGADRLEASVRATHDAVLRSLAACTADPGCGAAYPDLQARFAALLASLARSPVPVADGTFGASDLVGVVSDLSGTRTTLFPRAIAELERGVTTTAVALRDSQAGNEPAEEPPGSPPRAIRDFVALLFARTPGDPNDPLGSRMDVIGGLASALGDPDPRAAMNRFIESKYTGKDRSDLLAAWAAAPDDALAVMSEDARKQAKAPPEEAAERAAAGERNLQLIVRNGSRYQMNAIVCQEQLPFHDVKRALAARKALPVPELAGPLQTLVTELGNCAGLGKLTVDPADGKPVHSAVPTLVLQGEVDVRTPLAWGQSVVRGLTHGTLAVVPQQGHEVWTASSPCAASIAAAFLDAPQAVPDLSCLARRNPAFVLP